MYIHIYVLTYEYIHTNTYIYIILTYIYSNIPMYTCIHTQIHIYMYICKYIFCFSHIHTYVYRWTEVEGGGGSCALGSCKGTTAESVDGGGEKVRSLQRSDRHLLQVCVGRCLCMYVHMNAMWGMYVCM